MVAGGSNDVTGEHGVPRLSVPGSPGHILLCLRCNVASSRPELARCTGMSRTVVAQRVEALMAAGLVVEDGMKPSTGGRRAVRLRFAHEAGLVLIGHLGATYSRFAVSDLAGTVLAERSVEWPIGAGPVRTLDFLSEGFRELLGGLELEVGVSGVGIGLPGPIEHETGRAVSPSQKMPGWDGYPITEHLEDQFGAPVFVDNDVNLMALGEYTQVWRNHVADLLFIKVGTGIGCGVIASGQIYRGEQGAAGDIGHIRVPGFDDTLCRCGNRGCLGAVAGGQPIADRLAALGLDALNARSVSRLALAGEHEAVREVREAGRIIGEVLAAAVNLFNPGVVVVGGDVADAHEELLAGIREVVYKRSLTLATRHLRIVRTELGDRAGIIGTSLMVVDGILSPDAVDRLVEETT